MRRTAFIPSSVVFSTLWRVLALGALIGAVPVRATSVVAPSFNSLVGQADYIVHAVVKSVRAEMREAGPHRHIVTLVELDVREVISGTPPQPLVLQMLGGKVGTEEMVVDGAPRFAVGDEDILFVRGNGRQLNPLVALMHGRYPIKREAGSGRAFVARSDGAPLLSEQDVAAPLAAPPTGGPRLARSVAAALSPEEFASRIKAARTQDRSTSLEN